MLVAGAGPGHSLACAVRQSSVQNTCRQSLHIVPLRHATIALVYWRGLKRREGFAHWAWRLTSTMSPLTVSTGHGLREHRCSLSGDMGVSRCVILLLRLGRA